MPEKNRFSARAMFSDLKKQGAFFLIGAVKEHDEDKSLVLVSTAGDCTEWLPIHEELIESYERHGTLSCKDHTHPVVTLKLREPRTPEASVFARASSRERIFDDFSLRAASGGSATDCTWDRLHQRWVDSQGRPCIPR